MVWIATDNGGLSSFFNNQWTNYKTANSGIPGNIVYSLSYDPSGNLLIGTDRGAAFFDGNNWTVYNYNNSPLPDNNVVKVCIDAFNNKWFVTRYDFFGSTLGNLSRYDNNSWKTFYRGNSPLPDNLINVITPDLNGDLWIGTENGGLVHLKKL